ncbi:transcriptional regulator, AraC family [Sporobacter termitidis DSM 10068]|uniref:Transcriptional regulator, AraC family n=1 Tax=Sporobacter termitidis DSM 10068 TaxID=1123282 RepID=A0A1M5ZAG0_9FIRM|nr:AraC family transcriptional regulator [Sporobacter termitidis]SHI20883.1 transcriptional regulator, AraC family [Sporobacter termitidis DSM 10068]
MEHKEDIRRLLDYIERHLSRKLELEELAGIAFLSKYHFHRLFRQETGESVTSYIRRRRMARAAAELATTGDRILDIALRYQYGSHEAFTRAFKRIYSLTPEEYRRQHTAARHIGHHHGAGGTTMCARAA